MRSFALLLAAVLLLCSVGSGYSSGVGDMEKDVGEMLFSGSENISLGEPAASFEFCSSAVSSCYVSVAESEGPVEVPLPTAWGLDIRRGGCNDLLRLPGACYRYSGDRVFAWRC